MLTELQSPSQLFDDVRQFQDHVPIFITLVQRCKASDFEVGRKKSSLNLRRTRDSRNVQDLASRNVERVAAFGDA